MTTTIVSILTNYGFELNRGVLSWGAGSLVRGIFATVKSKGNNTYEVRYHAWAYDCWGDPIYDIEETVRLFGAQVLQYLFEKLPLF